MAENYEGEAIGYPAEVELDTVETPSPNYVVTLNSLAGAPRLVDEDGVDLETDDDAGTITVPGFVAGGAVRVDGSDVLISPTAAELVAANPLLGGGAADAALAGPWPLTAFGITQRPYPTLTATNHVVVTVTGNETTNGTNLATAYTAAKLLTPGGSALSASNRAYVVLPEGEYLRTTSLTLDTNFVDFIAETPVNPIHPDYLPRDTDFWQETVSAVAFYRPTGTVVKTTTPHIVLFDQTALDVRLMGFTLAQLGATFNELLDVVTAALLLPVGDYSASYYGQMVIWCNFGKWWNSDTVQPSRDGVSVSARNSIRGTWVDCFANGAGWRCRWTDAGHSAPVFDAKFLRCWSNADAFENNGVNGLNGAIFVDCHCKGAPDSAAPNPANSGAGCFGGTGGPIFPATVFISCSAGLRSFGVLSPSSEWANWPYMEIGGSFYHCRAGASSFGGPSVNSPFPGNLVFSGLAVNCVAGDYSFGGGDTWLASLGEEFNAGGTFKGTLIGCTIGKGSAGMGDGDTVDAGLMGGSCQNCRVTTGTWARPNAPGGEIRNCFNADGTAANYRAGLHFHLPSTTGYTGGVGAGNGDSPENLDGLRRYVLRDGSQVQAVKFAAGDLITFIHSTDGLRTYLVKAGTSATSSPGIIRFADYATTTNEFYLQSI